MNEDIEKIRIEDYGFQYIQPLYVENNIYTPFYPNGTKDFGFMIHQGPYKDIKILIKGDSMKPLNGNMVFDYKIVTNPNNLTKKELQNQNFIETLQVIINDIFTKTWKWEEKQKSSI